jgi:hypothetical protein
MSGGFHGKTQVYSSPFFHQEWYFCNLVGLLIQMQFSTDFEDFSDDIGHASRLDRSFGLFQ